MVEILRNKNLATRFQILVEVCDKGPNIKQHEIARKLGITTQAVSDYIRQLSDEGLLASNGRSRYQVTIEGVNWIIKVLRELRNYSTLIEKAITDISVSAAVAGVNLVKGQKVWLKMKDGMLLATNQAANGATGISTCDAKKGEDVGITDVDGLVALETGEVTILKIPNIQKGGSRVIDLDLLYNKIKGRPFIGAIGIESAVVLEQANSNFYKYGVDVAAIEAAHNGLDPLVVCVEDETTDLVNKLEEEKIGYRIIDTRKD